MIEKRGAEHPKATKCVDFGNLPRTRNWPGLTVATPGHRHAYISAWVVKHGLHTYCQRPLSRTVHEPRDMARVAAETLVTQMGTQTSAEAANPRTIELIRTGALGEITECHLSTNGPISPQGYNRPEGEDLVPCTLGTSGSARGPCDRSNGCTRKVTRSTAPLR